MIDILSILAGEWAGNGVGGYPTMESFEYLETLSITLDEARSLLHYDQQTQRRNIGQTDFIPSHRESGFLRVLAEGQVEIANIQSGGRVEVLTGTIEETATGLVLRFRSSILANDPRMQETTRVISVDGDTLQYTMHMQTTAVPELALHLEATLQRQ